MKEIVFFFFFLVMRNFVVYSLRDLPVYYRAVLAIVAVPAPPPGLTGLLGSLYFDPVPMGV